MENSLVSLFESMPFLVSLLAGILTFFSPCVLPLIPAYLSYISGVSIKELGNGELSKEDKFRIFKTALAFVCGFGLVFMLLGVSMASIIDDIFFYEPIAWVAGGIIIIFGLHTAQVITIPFLNYEKRAQFGDTKSTSLLAAFILGLSFALGWTPCIGPIFSAIVSMAAQEPTGAIALMGAYTVGLAIPFLAAAVLTSSALSFFTVVKKHFLIIERVAGALLVLVGIAIATGGLGKLSALMMSVLG